MDAVKCVCFRAGFRAARAAQSLIPQRLTAFGFCARFRAAFCAAAFKARKTGVKRTRPAGFIPADLL